MYSQHKQEINKSQISNSNTYRLNVIVGRDMEEDSSEPVGEDFNTFDTNIASVPNYMDDFIKNTYNYTDETYELDILASRLLEDTDYAYDFSETLISIKNAMISRDDELSVADLKELSKMQALIGAPIYHTPSVEGSHPKWQTTPSSWNIKDWNWAKDAGKWLNERFGLDDTIRVTLPRTTSQGILLKTSNDGKEWRILSKVIQAFMALKFESVKDLDRLEDALTELYDEFYLDNPLFDAVTGIRRQATNKLEPVQLEGSEFSTDFNHPNGSSRGIQGRVRAIFILNEVLKAYHKKPHEMIKKVFFNKCNCFLTHPGVIFAKQSEVILNTVLKNPDLVTDDGWLSFSDLSEYDRTQHEGFYEVAYDLIEGAIPNFAKKYGRDVMKRLSLLMPSNASNESSVIRQQVKGRSRLSGEPGVTTINNIVHALAASQAVGSSMGVKPLDIFKHICDPAATPSNAPYKEFIMHFHGDDAFRWLGTDPDFYNLVDSKFASFGLVAKPEDGPIYLKKVPKWYTALSLKYKDKIDKFSAIESVNSNDHWEIISQLLLSNLSCSTEQSGMFNVYNLNSVSNISIINKTLYSNLLVQSGSYPENYEFKGDNGWNVNHLFSGMMGSIIKNRFGEYPSKSPFIYMFSLVDTLDALDVYFTDNSLKLDHLWHLMSLVSDKPIDLSDLRSEKARAVIRDEYLDRMVDEYNDVSATNQLEKVLARLFYSKGETLISDSILEIYGTTQMDILDEAEALNLAHYDLEDLIHLLIQCQRKILLSDGGSSKELIDFVKTYDSSSITNYTV